MVTTADKTVAGPSTPTPTAKRTRGAKKQAEKGHMATSVEPSTTGEDGGLPAVKKQKVD